jgi:hypothetical protein
MWMEQCPKEEMKRGPRSQMTSEALMSEANVADELSAAETPTSSAA